MTPTEPAEDHGNDTVARRRIGPVVGSGTGSDPATARTPARKAATRKTAKKPAPLATPTWADADSVRAHHDVDDPLSAIFDPKTTSALTDEGFETLGDVIRWLPRAYLSPQMEQQTLEVDEHAVLLAEVIAASTREMRARRGKLTEITISDGGPPLKVAFFSSFRAQRDLTVGTRAIFSGKVSRYNGALQLAQPDYVKFDAEGGPTADLMEKQFRSGNFPVYRSRGRITSWVFGTIVAMVLDALGPIPDPIPEPIRLRNGLSDLTAAYRGVHQPSSVAERYAARQRLKYDEAFALQLILAQRRAAAADDVATARPGRDGALADAFDERLPFTLTEGQREIGEVLAAELAGTRPMHRLLQGEVGSGKTMVALRAMLRVVDSGGQAALLAPTEVLAQQHHRSMTRMLGDLAEAGRLGGSEHATRLALLTGSQPTAQRRRNLLDIASGEAGIAIGTHALIQDAVTFADLGLVVVDEQHRFGVEQRDALRAKASHTPHTLVMTATPIPRTVAMTAFGDLETSALRELPRGRSPITTHVAKQQAPNWMSRVWSIVAEQVRAGHQAYVVCSRIGDGEQEPPSGDEPPPEGEEQIPPVSAVEVHEGLAAVPELGGVRLGLLHGRMTPEDKDAVMARFAAGEIDVLVATTVIEVGVDVPNATVMVVLDADRFGVSQLHQLRGRVGRGSAPGLCFLASNVEGGPTHERLTAVASTLDGFALAEVDLEVRGEGDVLGSLQSGRRTSLQVLRLTEDGDTIEAARADATALVAEDPTLASHPRLARLLARFIDPDQAAFLERG